MRLAKFILTTILFISTFFIVMGAQYVIFRGVTSVGGDAVEVDRVHLFRDENNVEIVSYSDSLGFWGANFQEGVFSDNEYFVIRAWFKWNWWQQSMAWADWVYTGTLESVKTIFAPMYMVKEMGMYYGKTIEDFEGADYLGLRVKTALMIREDGFVAMTENEWLKEYNDIYNMEVKIAKYNAVDSEGNPVFERYIYKFYNEDVTAINATTALLFYQIFLALVLSMYFVYQNPINVRRNSNNESEIEGRALPRNPFKMPRWTRRRDRNKRNKQRG